MVEHLGVYSIVSDVSGFDSSRACDPLVGLPSTLPPGIPVPEVKNPPTGGGAKIPVMAMYH